MERPRAPPRARAIPRRPPLRAAFPSSPRVWARCLRHLPSSCGACRWSRRTITRSRLIAIRLAPLPHPLCAAASSTAMAWRLSRTVPHLLSWPTATLPRMRFWFAILPTCLECLTWRSFAIFRIIQRRTEPAYHRDGRPSLHGCLYSGACRRVPGRQDCRAYRAPVSIWRDGMSYLGLYRHHYLRAARGPE